MPFIMLSKGSTLANRILFHIEYFPCLILLFSIYLALNLVILPFTYLKGIKMAFWQMVNNKLETSRWNNLFKFIIFSVFGILILLLNLSADWVVFVQHLYQTKMWYRKVQTGGRDSLKLSPKSFEMLQSSFEAEHKNGRSWVKYKNAILPIREHMNVFRHIEYLIYTYTPTFKDSPTFEKSTSEVKEYSIIKKILHSWWIPKEDGLVISTEIMKWVMREIKISNRIHYLLNQFGKNIQFSRSDSVTPINIPEKFMRPLLKESDEYLNKLVSNVQLQYSST